MPKFDPKKQKPSGDNTPARRDAIPLIVEPRCHVCQSNYRKAIDRLIAGGTTSYTQIGKMFDVDRRSVSNHAQEHLGWEEAAIRRIVAEEAETAEQDFEEGVQGAIKRRIYLQVALQKALDALLNGDTTVEPKDALAIIQALEKLDGQTEGAAVDEIRVQFNAFVQAIREIVAPDVWHKILSRTKELLDEGEGPASLTPAPPD